MEHNEIRHRLSEYIDGSLPAGKKAAIEEHLKTCTTCSDALRELQKTIEYVKTVEELEPPAWMAQKIMSKVRTAESEQRSFLRKLFFPLSVKIPIQVVAVLFLVVGAFYLYRSIQPSLRPAEAPVKEFEAKKEVPPAPAQSDEQKRMKGVSKPAERVPQSPGYKALDMKQEYEKPALPALADKMAPAPAIHSEQPKPPTKAARNFAPQASTPVVAENQTAGASAMAGRESAAAQELMKSKTAAEIKSNKILLTLSVQQTSDAAQKAEALLTRMGGTVIKKEVVTNANVLTISLNSAGIQKFVNQLRELGTLKEKDLDATRLSGTVTIELVIVTPPQVH